MVDKSEIISFEGNRPLASQDALDFLLSRVSVSRVGGELPSTDALQKIFTAALRAPDHAGLKPWRYLKVAGEQREKLGELFVSAKLQDDPHLDQAAIDKLKKKPLRAPLVIVVIASIQDHPKVPEIEQMLSAGASAQNMLLAAHMQGIGAMWRTGSMTYHSRVREGLGVAQNEKIIGFIYMGSIEGKTRLVPEMNVSQYVKDWN
ncbi:nitroreductase [Pseudomonadales bacterium]|jgi:nitroreductase|nr:nitroreductase [Pseudomonadales bacterium]